MVQRFSNAPHVGIVGATGLVGTMMRELLYLRVEGSVGALFVAACVEHCSSNEQRRGPRKLAAGLLEELQRAA